MKRMRAVFLVSGSFLFSSVLYVTPAFAGCTLTRTSCTHECIETNQHGQCVKTKKVCEEVCVQFDVDVSGQDTHNYPPPEQRKEEKKK